MATSSLTAALLRRSRLRNLRVADVTDSCSSSPISRPFSSAQSNTEVLAADEVEPPPAAPEDDLRSRIFRLRLPKRSATAALDQWVGEGRSVAPADLRHIAKELRGKQRYKHALEISEWMKAHQESDLSDSDYAMRIDLITKVFGINVAEDYFDKLPLTAKSTEVYTALLHYYAAEKLTGKAEELFEKMKESNLCLSVLPFNEMMTMYISVGQLDKVSLLVEDLKKQNISPDLFTYNLWISASAGNFDIDIVRRILDEMAHDSKSNKGWETYRRLTSIYLTAANIVTSDFSLVEADAKISQREWITYDFLIILYTGLGNKERINEIWKSLRMATERMSSRNYICIISSYLLLEQFKEVGEVIEEWKHSKAQNFEISACNRVFDALMNAGLADTAEVFRGIMLQKNCEITSTCLQSYLST